MTTPQSERETLTPKEDRFCREYVVDYNATQAAIRAGYSICTSGKQASRILKRPAVQTFIEKLQQEIASRLDISADAVVRELAKVGFANIQDFLEADNQVKDVGLLKRDKAAAVASVKVSTTSLRNTGIKTTVELKLCDKISALEKLGKHLGVFTDKPVTTGKSEALTATIMLSNGNLIEI